MSEYDRSRAARAAAEAALVRVVHFYGATPAFVLIGGLVPPWLCSTATVPHAGTSDIDVQVDLEIASDFATARRLEDALIAADFVPDGETWRWQTTTSYGTKAVVKFELLADVDDQPTGSFPFPDCERLGAANIRGTGYATRDAHHAEISADVNGSWTTVTIRHTGLAGFLMAKVHAAKSRSKDRDWYDIAYVLLHNDAQIAGEQAVIDTFGSVPEAHSALVHLAANFEDTTCLGPNAYAVQLQLDDPQTDPDTAATDAMLVVQRFCARLLES